ncbi:arginine-ornithine antiporter [Oenococcus oeni]
MKKRTKKSGIGLISLIAIVINSSIGAGIFGLISGIASSASPGAALIAWMICGIGILGLVLSINNLVLKKPKLNGIFVYAQEGFGPFAGFISGWGYWLSSWLSNIAFATMLMSATGFFFPVFGNGQNLPSVVAASILSWVLTVLVNRGIESASFINTFIAICKLIPIFIFITFSFILFKFNVFDSDFWSTFNSNISSGFHFGDVANQIRGCLMVIMWVFVGIEGASVMAKHAKSKRDVGLATVLGLSCLLAIYVLVSILPYGILSQAKLSQLRSPSMQYLFQRMVGKWGGTLIGLGVVISITGSWLSWTMIPAQTMSDMANEGLLPKIFGRTNKRNASTFALFSTECLFQLFLLTLLVTDKAYIFAYSLCTVATIVTYVFVAAYQIKFSLLDKELNNKRQFFYGIIAFVFQVNVIILAGIQYLLLCLIAYIPGIYCYVRARKEQGKYGFSSNEKKIATLIVFFGFVAIGLLALGFIKT